MSFSFSHNLFNKASAVFVDSVSREGNLIASPSLDEASNCRPYRIVLKQKKKNFLPFRSKVLLIPTRFTLANILDDDEDGKFDEIDPEKTNFVKFEQSLEINAKGKLGASLALEVARVELAANQHIAVSVDFGQVVEKSLNILQLSNSVEGRRLNVKNTLIREVMAKERITLCIVVTSLSTEAESKITTGIQTRGKFDVGFPVSPTNKINAGGCVSVGTKCLLEIPSNTPIAYRMLEILVQPDFSIQLMHLPGSKGGFMTMREEPPESMFFLQSRANPSALATVTTKKIPASLYLRQSRVYPSALATATGSMMIAASCNPSSSHGGTGPGPNMEEIQCQLEPLLTLPDAELSGVRHFLVELLKQPILLDNWNIMFQEVFNSLLVGEGGKQTTKEILLAKIGCPDLDVAKPLLQVAGFSFEEDSVMFPTADENDILSCTSNLLELLASLNEDQGRILYECSEKEKETIGKVLAGMIAVGRQQLDQQAASDLFEGPKQEDFIRLFSSFGLHHEKESDNWYLSSERAEASMDDLSSAGLLVIIRALWNVWDSN